MPFPKVDTNRKSFKKVNYLNLTPGSHMVRLLQEPATALTVFTHYLVTKTGAYTVQCLGEDCPVCDNNRKIYLENPKTFRDVPGYFSRSTRYLMNVLDRTVVKTCPSCQTEVKKVGNDFPSNCPNTDCGAFLIKETPHPLNKVRVLTIGPDTAQRLDGIEKSTTDLEGNLLPLTTFDISFLVEGAGRKKVTQPLPATNRNDVVTVPEDQLEDLTAATMKLSADEIIKLLKGISLKDIFVERKSTEPVAESAPVKEEVAEAVKAQSDEIIKQLFGE
jgi:hypothetical protein